MTLPGPPGRRCRCRWGHRQDDTLDWLRAATTTTLPPLGAALVDLEPARAELEFWLPVESLGSGRIDAICRRHLLVGLDRPTLPQRQLRGMLMGFADLVFEHAGRYWVLDYKSNALGSHDSDYDAEALAAEMMRHRYDVQGALYLLALHRLLKSRLKTYSPAQQLGGVIFFFLRGIRSATAGCYTMPSEPALLEELDAAMQTAEVL